MKVYHQTGHLYQWNLQSFIEDQTGDGLIFSPINIKCSDMIKIPKDIKKESLFDSQFYIPDDMKGKLSTYNFFPANMKDDFSTCDFEEIAEDMAGLNVNFQITNDFRYIVIPTRHFEFLSDNCYEQLKEYYINPFIKYISEIKSSKKVLLTVIVKQEQLVDENKRNFLLNWVTGISNIDGVYLIFENKHTSKQIKDPVHLCNAMIFIHSLKVNQLEVHVGYTNTEGILYSIADPDSVSMGSYENVRKFNINKFITPEEKKKQRGPTARLYSGKLFQWIEYGFIESIVTLYEDWEMIFENSKYNPLMFEEEYKWYFNKPELYKHYFLIFSSQIKSLPGQNRNRIKVLRKSFENAINIYDDIKSHRIFLDSDSDGSHLYHWLNSMSMFEEYLRSNGYEI